ncbi:MAG: hypothetical protein OSJ83_10220 [Clostridia bacterium]|nr:hypothetical protein [Clostridia bacterium]
MGSKRDKLISFLIKPPLWFCIVMWTLGAVGVGGSITLYYLGLGAQDWALAVHIGGAVFLVLSIYAVLTVIGIPERAKDKPRVQKFFSSYSTRAFVYASCSIIFNGCYVAFGMVVANVTHSPWLGVLVGYHIFLLLPRILVIAPKLRNRKREVDEKRQQLRSYSYSGLALVLLAIAILPVIRMIVEGKNSYNYFVGVIAYVSAIALYTFIKFGISLYNLKKVRGTDDMSLIAVKNVSFADALISIFVLQAMMLKELQPQSNTAFLNARLNPITGVLISVAICALGLHMLIGGIKKLKAYNRELAERDGSDGNVAPTDGERKDDREIAESVRAEDRANRVDALADDVETDGKDVI